MKTILHTTLHHTALLIVTALLLNGCTISYKFNGASIDYSTTKTISIADFPNVAPLVYAPLSNNLSDGIRDLFQRQTRLEQVNAVVTSNWTARSRAMHSLQCLYQRIVMQQKPN